MDQEEGNVTVERTPPEDVFGLLASDTRVEILRQLGESLDRSVSFSELRKRVGVEDSGQFNYHLKQLQGTLVRKDGDSYTLTHAGRQIVGAIYAGTYTADATVDPLTTGVECPACETDFHAEYVEEMARITCECDQDVEYFFPPGALEGFDNTALPAAFYRWNYLTLQRILAGFCPLCAGRMGGEMVLDGDARRMTPLPAESAFETVHFEFECRRCGNARQFVGTSPAIVHPGVAGFLSEHDIDIRTDPIWEIRKELDSPELTVLSTEPPRLEVRFTYEDDAVVVVIAEDGTVTNVDRVDE